MMQPGMEMQGMMQVQVPDGFGPGMAFQVQNPQGMVLNVMVPQGMGPGQVFTIDGMGNPVMPQQQMGMQQPMPMQQPMGMPMQQPGQMGGMQQPMMQPGMMQPPMQQQPMVDAWAIIAAMPSCEVQEEIRWGEVLTQMIGVEIDFANKYKVVDPNGVEVMLFAEQTDFCTRQLKRGACADCVGWDVDAINIYGGANQPFMKMKRDFTFTCCCFNRPVVDIKDYNTDQLIGSIRDPYALCDLTFSLMGPDGEDVLQAKGGCCQWGLCCQCPCGPCSEVNFEIVDAKSQDKVGHIKKKVPSCMKCLIDSEISNYEVDFQKVDSPQWKAMLMALSVFIDFRYFSTTQDPGDIGNDGLIGAAAGGGMFGGGGDEGGGDFDFGGDE